MDEPVSFAARRADKLGDAGVWTAEDCLVETLRKIRAGELKLESVIVMGMEPTSEGREKLFITRAGTTHHSTLALLTLATHDAVEEWRE